MKSGVIVIITLSIMFIDCMIVRMISSNGVIPYIALTLFQQKCVVILLVINMISASVFAWFFADYMNNTVFVKDLITRTKIR